MTKFDKTYDWTILLDHLGIEVTDQEIQDAREDFEQFGLSMSHEEYLESVDKTLPSKVAGAIVVDDYDIEEALLCDKFRLFVWNEILEPDMHGDDVNEEACSDIRDFVEQHADDSIAKSGLFFEKLSEIKDDWVFFSMLTKNIQYMWY